MTTAVQPLKVAPNKNTGMRNGINKRQDPAPTMSVQAMTVILNGLRGAASVIGDAKAAFVDCVLN